jgi:protein-disulfide isomerase
MASKRRKKRALNTASRSGDQNSSLGLKSYSLIIGVIALVVIAVAAWAILGPERSRSAQPQLIEPAEISLDKSIGPENAPVVVVEYGDFQCPYCQQFAAGPGRQIKQTYVDKGQVRFVFRHLAFIGAESLWAAEASECANEQGRFWDYHDKLFEEQAGENTGAFSQENLKRFAAELELDTQQFTQCLDSDKYRAKVQQEIDEAERLGVRSTPTLFVNGRLIENGANYQVLQAAIEAALAEKR